MHNEAMITILYICFLEMMGGSLVFDDKYSSL